MKAKLGEMGFVFRSNLDWYECGLVRILFDWPETDMITLHVFRDRIGGKLAWGCEFDHAPEALILHTVSFALIEDVIPSSIVAGALNPFRTEANSD